MTLRDCGVHMLKLCVSFEDPFLDGAALYYSSSWYNSRQPTIRAPINGHHQSPPLSFTISSPLSIFTDWQLSRYLASDFRLAWSVWNFMRDKVVGCPEGWLLGKTIRHGRFVGCLSVYVLLVLRRPKRMEICGRWFIIWMPPPQVVAVIMIMAKKNFQYFGRSFFRQLHNQNISVRHLSTTPKYYLLAVLPAIDGSHGTISTLHLLWIHSILWEWKWTVSFGPPALFDRKPP